MIDSRIVHLWDPQDLAGDWFVAHEPDDQAGDWDAYLLFGPTARWTNKPPPLISSGGSVIDTKDDLAHSITPLLTG